MFDLEKSILGWREQMLAMPASRRRCRWRSWRPICARTLTGRFRPEPTNRRPLKIPLASSGRRAVLKHEFVNARETPAERLKKLIFCPGPNSKPATHNQYEHSRFQIPKRAGPPMPGPVPRLSRPCFLWLFTVVFGAAQGEPALPGGPAPRVFDFANTPFVFRVSALVGQVMIFLTNHGLLIGGAVITGVFPFGTLRPGRGPGIAGLRSGSGLSFERRGAALPHHDDHLDRYCGAVSDATCQIGRGSPSSEEDGRWGMDLLSASLNSTGKQPVAIPLTRNQPEEPGGSWRGIGEREITRCSLAMFPAGPRSV